VGAIQLAASAFARWVLPEPGDGYPHPGGAGVCFGAAWVQDQDLDSPGEQRHMRSGKAAEANADVEARIAQIEQMTLDQMATFQGRMLADIATGRIAPREASALGAVLN
jgi:hypothetical protein